MKEQSNPANKSAPSNQQKDEQLDAFRNHSDEEFLTTNQGVRVNHTDDSLKAGERGPTVMEDFHFREKMTHFDHERIPERIVHARGSAAHGYFQVYKSMAEYTKAAFLQDPTIQTPVFVRFSTVVGFRGTADTVRDARGFAVKFYTQDGNYDLVGNNIPVFFIQDAIKFPDLVHAIKPEPHHEMPQASAAHDNFWDFISLMPESMHMIFWVLSDRAIPRSYSMMEGFGVHTFRFVNEQGKARFVKFHWKPVKGMHSLVWDEAQKIAGKDPDFNRRDLWESIEKGDYPEFELGVQIVEEEDEHKFDFDLLDPTKIIPEELVPVQIIGKMVLNCNPDNFFAETEQVAFHPGNVVPGIDFTNDPLLQGRLFSYLDTQLIRLGGPNFHELPVNRPVAAVNNNQRDGFGRQTIHRGRTNYYPNSLGDGHPRPASEQERGYAHYAERVDGHKIRTRSESFHDHFSQARLFWNSQSAVEKQHITDAFLFELGKVESMEVRKRMVDLIANVDRQLAERVAKGIGVAAPGMPQEARRAAQETAVPVTGKDGGDKPASPSKTSEGKLTIDRSPVLSMANTRKDSVKGRKLAVLVAEGSDTRGLMQVKQAFEAAGAQVELVSKNLGMLAGTDGQPELKIEKSFLTTGSIMYDAVFIPGGQQATATLRDQGDAIHFLNEAFKHCKPIAALDDGVDMLADAHIIDVFFADGGENKLRVDKGVVTARGSGSLEGFTHEFMQAVAMHRHWEREAIKNQIPA